MGNFVSNFFKKHVPNLNQDAFSFHFEPLDMKHYESLFAVMQESSNLFSTTHEQINRSLDTASVFASSIRDKADIGWRPEEGILGIGNFSYDMSWWATPNLEQFNVGSQKFGANVNWLGDKLSGKGYLHDQVKWKFSYVGEKVGELVDFAKDPAGKLLRDGKTSVTTSTTTTTAKVKHFKGAGTLKGKTPHLRLNRGAKGLGRSSLRIGTEGMGTRVDPKYKSWISGRYTRPEY